jgi:uncharacterized protein (DUF488 family)
MFFTVGHGTRTLKEFRELLQKYKIKTLVDVRSFTRSRHNPQFNKDKLEKYLKKYNINYIWIKSLGGRRPYNPESEHHTQLHTNSFRYYAGYMESKEFKDGIKELLQINEIKKNKNVCIMCAETLFWRCHRRLISDYLIKRKQVVYHIGISKEPIKYTMWDIARSQGRNLIYDVKVLQR